MLAGNLRYQRRTSVTRQHNAFVRGPYSGKLRLVALSVLRHRDSYCASTYGIVGSRYRVTRGRCHATGVVREGSNAVGASGAVKGRGPQTEDFPDPAPSRNRGPRPADHAPDPGPQSPDGLVFA
ncbi:hypothetical protein GCM10009612_04080 [Streptomyces beijiangensis]